MRGRLAWTSAVDEAGRLVLPDEARLAGGLTPGAVASVELDDGRLLLKRPATQFAKLYIEPTTKCNLACRMCIRNTWTEPIGEMSEAVFDRILEGLRAIRPTPLIVFSGYGEPLVHPRLAVMVAAVKRLGATAEVVTNGTLLTKELSGDLLEAGLDRLWVSVDGARPESYVDIRPQAQLAEVLDKLADFAWLGSRARGALPEIGIVFVAMRRNIGDLPSLVRISMRMGASRVIVTNVTPYSPDMCAETLYAWAVRHWPNRPSPWAPEVRLPNIDVSMETRESLMSVLRPGGNVRFLEHARGDSHDRCPFIEQGAAAVGWDGSFGPCPTLLHDQVTYLQKRRRSSRRYVIGNVAFTPLQDLWGDAPHLAFRERVRAFEFSPCTSCGGCDLSEANEEDCFGNAFPTCGGCLWAQGVLQCP